MTKRTFGEIDARIEGGTDRQGAGHGPVVILLHGFGAPGDDLAPLARVLMAPPGTRFLFPQGPIALGAEYGAGRAWWRVDLEARIRRQAAGERHDVDAVPEGLAEARAKMSAFLDEVETSLRPPKGKMVLGGFSQGAMLSLDVALHSSHALAGLALLSGTHTAGREWASRFEARRRCPVFMSHGKADEILPFSVAEHLRDTLTAAGMTVTWVPFPGGHAIPPNVIDGMSAFLRRVLAEPP